MCKQWAIKYTCDHVLSFRLSTCRANFKHKPRKGTIPVSNCKGRTCLWFTSKLRCGPCSKTMTEKALEISRNSARARLGADDWNKELSEAETQELDKLEEEYNQDKWRLEKQYPDQGKIFKKAVRPEKGVRSTTRTTSLLSVEVKPEEVVVKEDVVKSPTGNGWEDWGEGWKSLEKEIEENDEERKAAGIEFSWYNSTATCQTAEAELDTTDDDASFESEVRDGATDDTDIEIEDNTCLTSSIPENTNTSEPSLTKDDTLDSGCSKAQKVVLGECGNTARSLGLIKLRQQHRDCFAEVARGFAFMV